MATRTTNFGLYKPDPTDDFGDFLPEFNANMDEIDEHLGGGGGSSSLAGLSDVNLTSPVTNDALIYDGAEWANSPLSAVAFSGDYTDLLNTPTIPTKTSDLNNDSDFVSDSAYVHTDNNFTNADVTKLSGIQAGAEVNVQSDWNEADNTADDYIKNKPTIPTNTSDLNNDSGFLDSSDITVTQVQTAGTKIATIDVDGNSTDLYAPTGGGGSYTEGDGIDITSNTISVDTTFTEASTRANIASGDTFSTILGKIKKFFTDLKTVAFTGAYSDLSGQPTNVSQFTNDSGYITSSGTAANVSGTVAIANGGTGANTRLDAAKNLTNEEVTAPTHVVGLTNNWGKFGWTTLANLVTALGVVKKSGDTMTGALTINRSADIQAVFSRNHTGTSSAVTSIDVGNNVADGTAGSTYGRIRLFGKRAYRTNITASASTANRDIEFPNKSGTIALTSDIPDVSGKVNKSGDTMTGTLKIDGGNGIQLMNGAVSTILYQQSTAGAVVNAIEMPNGTGTLALRSDIPSKVSQLTNDSGFITSSGTSARITATRLNSKNLNNIANQNTLRADECNSNCSNLPSAYWYYVFTIQGSDTGYAGQLAMQMTGGNAVYYRAKDGGTWSSWRSL